MAYEEVTAARVRRALAHRSDVVTVDHPGYSADRALAAWLQRTLDFVGTLPARTPA